MNPEKSGRSETTRERLLDVAAGLFAEKGFDAVSVRDITRAASANLGAVTYHFGGKEGLFAEVMARRVEPLLGLLRKVAESGATRRERLAMLLRESSLHILHRDPTLKAFFAESLHGGRRLPEAAVRGLRERHELSAGLIREGIDAGEFRPCNADHAAWILFGSIMPYVLHEPMIHPRWKREAYSVEQVEELVDTALTLFFEGLEVRRAP